MPRQTNLALFMGFGLFLGALAVGCSHDPNVQKQKFLQQGNRDFDKGKYPEATISYRRALQIDPRFVEAHYKLAQCHLRQSSWAAAYQELSRTVDLQPENWSAQQDLGQLFLAVGKYQEARDRALSILRGNAKQATAQILLSDADVALGKLKDGLREARVATEMAPDLSAGYINLGLIQVRVGAFGDAEANLKKAQTLDTASIAPLMSLGNFYQKQERWTDAEKEYRAAIGLAPKNPLPAGALASLYVSQGQDSHAEKVLRDAKQQLSDDPTGYRMLGDYYLRRGENDKALAEFAALSAAHKNDLQVSKTYVQLLILNRRIGEATQLNDEILKKSPQDPEALILKGQVLLQEKKWDESIQILQQALKNASENAMGHYQLGVAFQGKGNPQQAESEWHEAVRLRPALTEAWLALGNSALQRGEWGALEQISNQLKKIGPRFVEGYLYHATARINQGDAVGAEADLNHLIQVAPQSAIGYVKVGQLRVAQKRWVEAEKMYLQGLSREPNSLDAVQGLVDLDFRRNKPADALKLLQTQIEHNPDSAGLYLLQGEALLKNKQTGGAERALTRSVEIDKQNVNAVILLARVQTELGSRDKAIFNYQRAIELSPNNVRPYVELGSLYETHENWQQAQTLYQKALAIQPEDPLAANNLAYLMLEHSGSVNVALTLAQTARRGLPGLPNSADTLGWAYYHNGAFSVAAPLLEEAVKKAPSSSIYHYHLGLIYQKLNESGRARTELEKSISIDPKSPIAEQARRAIDQAPGT